MRIDYIINRMLEDVSEASLKTETEHVIKVKRLLPMIYKGNK